MSITSRLPRFAHALPRWAIVVGVLALGVSAAVGLTLWPPWKTLFPKPTVALGDDPRLTYPTPYLNVRPEVQYVGDTRCAECHADKVRTFQQHSMGRSLAPMAAVIDLDRFDTVLHNPFDNSGFVFRAERRGQQEIHTATRRTKDGKDLYEITHEVTYAVGSGRHGRSYLIERDGFLYQSPISWFPQANRWDLSPGYGATMLFDRPVIAMCLFCHCNQAQAVEQTVNRYQTPIFHGYSIGCERCHGPAELHLRARDANRVVSLPDETIVNPGRLEPVLRDSICEQCHLGGDARIVRRGRQTFDFRPGMPLHLFWSVFVEPVDSSGHQFVGHVEQMQSSVCAQKSGGKMACISCHDPHRLPDKSERVAYYRDACMKCHEDRPCNRQPPPPGDKHIQDHRDNNCSACHMPRRDDTEVVHTIVTDHRILRRPGRRQAPGTAAPPDEMPVLFHKDLLDAKDPELARDIGMALIQRAILNDPYRKEKEKASAQALPLLNEAIKRQPDDIDAREMRGFAYKMQGLPADALADFEAVLHRVPGRQQCLEGAADMATQMEAFDAAESYWRRAKEVSPNCTLYHVRLAELLHRRGQWKEAVEECRAALRLNPAADIRKLLVVCLLRGGKRGEAEAEFQTILQDKPEQERALRDWWEKEKVAR